MKCAWQLKSFHELSTDELYNILKLRSEVFVVEQNCVYLDMDNKDQSAFHLMGWHENQLIAYVRILPPGNPYVEPSIGRVITAAAFRRDGIGTELMETAIQKTTQLFGTLPIRIGAQIHLQNFYSALGFKKCSDPYLEDGIEHVEMIRTS